MVESQVVTEEKARELRTQYLGSDLVELLTAETPKEIIDERPARGGTMVKYVAGHHFIRKLNDCFGFFWNYEVPHSFELNGQIVAKGELSVTIPGRTITRKLAGGLEESIKFDAYTIKKTQFGSSEIKRYSKDVQGKGGKVLHKAGDIIDLGDDYKGAATDAMKKCSTLFGIFLDVYAARGAEEEGVVTGKQLEVFYWRAEKAGMTKEQADKWGEEQLEKPIKDWDPLDAMGLIPKLMDMAEAKEKEKS